MANGPFKATDREAHWQKYVGTETSNGSMLRPNYKFTQQHPKTSYIMRYPTQDPREKTRYVPECIQGNQACSFEVRKNNRQMKNQDSLEMLTPNPDEEINGVPFKIIPEERKYSTIKK